MDEPLAVLLLPARLEGFELEDHARDLLSIPRVIALEPSRVRTPRFMREATTVRQAARLRFPGSLRLLVLYHPAQYPLARALCAHHEEAEFWYVPPVPAALEAADQAQSRELLAFDEFARERAEQTLAVIGDAGVEDAPLRLRLRELAVINPRPFVPGGRFRGQ
ncbi:MAG: hypothetical protein ACR2MK_11645 [Solirubrobacteraceae bacterium]